ncbi:5-methyltetrahydropteroyltriglutamate--homocysteine S-methyltransferase [Salipaludibacillus agaradhaerens]|uniref:5-methyltetrahydropteroyltriglutamate-- homocysteine S-methyltransferase n=1 Tax=Salipaludibacillus agaradhaerens TaxID=76935 RepID=UPI0009968011|nr:5-methyltetrahydropteroyltriglutamate--homocysteine S-methyltransferase [Salipaludibacillus agaradhaerens]
MKMALKTSQLGYPRIGEQREWKRTLEAYWKGERSKERFYEEMKQIRLSHLQKQRDAYVDYIPVGDFSFYDHVLDTALMFNVIPERFAKSPADPLDTYFAMARGSDDGEACEMTKWFDTNYHYIVPEFHRGWVPKVTTNYTLQAYEEAKKELGIEAKPVLIGPFTFLKLSKGYTNNEFPQLAEKLVPLYEQVISELYQAGASLIQLDEPSLVTTLSEGDIEQLKGIYRELAEKLPEVSLLLQTYFGSIDHFEQIVSLPVKGIGLDFIHDKGVNLQAIKAHGFPEGKLLGAGIIDGRNIWKTDVRDALSLLTELQEVVPSEHLLVQPSSSLLHVPVTLKYETKLDQELLNGLSYAEEKLYELHLLKTISNHPTDEAAKQTFEEYQQSVDTFKHAPFRKLTDISTDSDLPTERTHTYEERKELQEKKWHLPFLPTTTIGSFPQTRDVKRTRTEWRRGELDDDTYDTFVKGKIEKWITIQEEVGLDVFVHGEFERNDMVEYFGEKLNGFAVTQNGWVQSYGSRCVKPPVVYGNVSFEKPMTVKETKFAQSLTKKPVKGMLTGPVTILNWSFVRNDIPNRDVTRQIAKALVEEVKALEQAGIEMIQMDEPALREGLPLKKHEQQAYLDWAVEAFRLATAQVKPTTQIHTHMCYCEFHDIIDSIKALDADVISIETSRSHGELIETFKTNVYDKGIGLGVYDIHSPQIPNVEKMLNVIKQALNVLPAQAFWVNPDCGLKTRTEEQTIAALKNMVTATKKVREEWKVSQ